MQFYLAAIRRSVVLFARSIRRARTGNQVARTPKSSERTDLLAADDWHATDVAGNSIAYLLFTSGSTGQPKGVMVSHANVLHYVDYVTKRYRIESDDRFSQTFDLTFDLSAHDYL